MQKAELLHFAFFSYQDVLTQNIIACLGYSNSDVYMSFYHDKMSLKQFTEQATDGF